MNLIGIDPSINSTAVVANDKIFIHTTDSAVYTKKGNYTKWFGYCENLVNIQTISFSTHKDYSKLEILKLIDYDTITTEIVNNIKVVLDDCPTKVYIEGYSYSSVSGDLIDLVTFSTLLRKKLYEHITKDIKVIAPSTLKKETAILTYNPINEGKRKEKWVYRNNEGVAGGNFKKPEMYKAIVENDDFKDEWANHLREIYDEVSSLKSIHKPYDDINDAYLLRKLCEKSK